jgi:hypothetical protein
MLKLKPGKQASTLSKLAAAVIAATVGCGSASAQQSPGAPVPSAIQVQLTRVNLTDLETAFWACEYAATVGGNATIASCTAVYDALKERKFGGDFDGLLRWWQQNRVSEYRRLEGEAQVARAR